MVGNLDAIAMNGAYYFLAIKNGKCLINNINDQNTTNYAKKMLILVHVFSNHEDWYNAINMARPFDAQNEFNSDVIPWQFVWKILEQDHGSDEEICEALNRNHIENWSYGDPPRYLYFRKSTFLESFKIVNIPML